MTRSMRARDQRSTVAAPRWRGDSQQRDTSRTLRVFVLALAMLGASASASAEDVRVGVFAPTAPFPSTAARVELASRLGDHLGKALGGTGTGRVYARAADFAAAIKRGEITVALVDAGYLAHTGGYAALATSVRAGATTHGWQLVARGAGLDVAALAGKRVLVPSIGGREAELVLNVLLGGELRRDHFAKFDIATDTASALSALGLGRADAAVVPTGVDLPAGVTTVLALPAISNPVLVTYGNVPATTRTRLAEAAARFQGDATIAGFRASDADGVRAIARRFTPPVKRGPMAVPAPRLVVGGLVEGRTFAIERTPPAAFAILPVPAPRR
jgi:hypothetical protein